MMDIVLSLSLPALRAFFAIAGGAQCDSDLRAQGVSRSCVNSATCELRQHDLITTVPGRAAALGVRGMAALHKLTHKIDEIVELGQMTLAQARVLIATRAKKYESTRSLAKKCGLSEPSTRDAIKFLAAKNLLNEHADNFHSTPPNFAAPRETVPRELAQHTEKASVSDLKTELRTVLNSKEKQTAVVVNFSIYQKLLENGIANDVAAQLIAQDEFECELQIKRIEKLKNMPLNRAGYLRTAIALKYRDFDNKKHEPIPPKKVEEFPFERRTDGSKPPAGMLESLKISLGGAA